MYSNVIEIRNKHKKESKSSFNITGGRYKNLKLYLHSNTTTRPTKALIKKSFFDSMQDIIPNCIFIECFAGSGQMGLEALSRGARSAIFFEKNLIAYQNLQKNIALFQYRIDEDIKRKANMQVLTSQLTLSTNFQMQIKPHFISFFDSSGVLEGLGHLDGHIVMYLDPPFPSAASNNRHIYDDIFCFIQTLSNPILQKIHVLIMESISSYQFYENVGGFHIVKTSKFGKTTLTYFKH